MRGLLLHNNNNNNYSSNNSCRFISLSVTVKILLSVVVIMNNVGILLLQQQQQRSVVYALTSTTTTTTTTLNVRRGVTRTLFSSSSSSSSFVQQRQQQPRYGTTTTGTRSTNIQQQWGMNTRCGSSNVITSRYLSTGTTISTNYRNYHNNNNNKCSLIRTRPPVWILQQSLSSLNFRKISPSSSVLFSTTNNSNNSENDNDKTSATSTTSTTSSSSSTTTTAVNGNTISSGSTTNSTSTGGVAFPNLSPSSSLLTSSSKNNNNLQQQQSDQNITESTNNSTTRSISSSTTDASLDSTTTTTTTPNNDNNNGGNAFDANSVLAIDPKIIKIITVAEEEQKIMDTYALEALSNSTTSSTDGGDDPATSKSSTSNTYTPNAATAMDLFISRLPFVDMFRGSANYIANHRNTVAVYHIPGGLVDGSNNKGGGIETNTIFRDLMNDVALTWLLGMRIVIVAGCRYQIEKRLAAAAASSANNNNNNNRNDHGLRVTDEATLRIVKEEAGYVRFEVERQLARSLRMQGTSSFVPGGTAGSSNGGGGSGGGGSKSEMNINGGSGTMMHGNENLASPSSPSSVAGGSIIGGGTLVPRMPLQDGNVVSGNFYFAQPFGILDGTDYKYSGFVRRVEVEKIRRLHDSRDICLLTSLGVSPSGEVFNVNSESLAATVAGALGASKVIYFTEQEMELRHAIHNNKIHSLRIFDARNLLKYHNIQIHRKGYITTKNSKPPSVDVDDNDNDDDNNSTANNSASTSSSDSSNVPPPTEQEFDMLSKVGWCTEAIALGVKRAHIISPKHGALLQELYTRDGSGTLICADLYEGIRRADCTDVAGIHDLISPLIRKGTLIDRPKAQLEKDIDTYYVYTRDSSIVACGQLKKFEDGYAEIGCLVVNKEFRSRGRGDAMLGYLERLCLLNSCNKIFVLSTQTMEWFIERGFKVAQVEDLPPSRQATYNYQRKSKIYLKIIENDRDLDASELWWNR